jgi:predicted NUDIX family NTP pyrophosphohydrolase
VRVKNYPPAGVGKMTEKDEDEVVAFGMTMSDIAKTADALSKHIDNNHPAKSGSYADFLEVKNVGHKALLGQKGYGKIN